MKIMHDVLLMDMSLMNTVIFLVWIRKIIIMYYNITTCFFKHISKFQESFYINKGKQIDNQKHNDITSTRGCFDIVSNEYSDMNMPEKITLLKEEKLK